MIEMKKTRGEEKAEVTGVTEEFKEKKRKEMKNQKKKWTLRSQRPAYLSPSILARASKEAD